MSFFSAPAPHLTTTSIASRRHPPGPASATALSPRRAARLAAVGGSLHPAAAAQEAAPNGQRGPGEGGGVANVNLGLINPG